MLSRFPYPMEKGDKLRAFYQLRELSEDWDLYVICLTECDIKNEEKSIVAAHCKELYIFKLNRFSIFINVFNQFFTKKPFQVGYFFQRKINNEVQKLLHQIQPNHIFCQLIRVSEYVKNYHHCPKTIDYMDALSAGIKRRIPLEKFHKRWLFRSEWKRLKYYENIIFDYFELHTIISDQDKALIAHPKKQDIVVIPNGVGEHFFEHIQCEKTHDLVFTGNLSYPPNVTAVQYIANQIIPEATKRGLTLRVLVSGANPSKELDNLPSSIEITGWVDDIRESYARGRIFIAPMFIGTGLQNKLLEAMAQALPCITTPLANNALKANVTQVVLAETKEEFVNAIEILLNEEKHAKEIGINGCSYIKENYDWKSITAKLSQAMLAISN
jgi:polysaccharide biosynthesis protein PslH